MRVTESYQAIKPAIVAFCARYSNNPKLVNPGTFPHIIGTGFVIDPRGIVLTNQHVVDAFQKVPRPTGTHALDAVSMVMMDQHGLEMKIPGFEIQGVTKIASHTPIDGHFDRRPPDIALVGVNVCDLPYCTIRTKRGGIVEGLEVATAGFPMGNRGLVDPADGLVQQLSPVLQTGIISAIQPFATECPVSFTISVLLQNGASGSPVFNPESGEVIGVAFQRRFEPSHGKIVDEEGKEVKAADGKEIRAVVGLPTNFSLVVPTYAISFHLQELTDEITGKLKGKQTSFKNYHVGRTPIDIKTGRAIDIIQSTTENQVAVRNLNESKQDR